MPQHWVNVFIGLILIVAVLIDIWVRQANIFGGLRARLARRDSRRTEAGPCLMTQPTPIVEMRGIDKAFGAVQALRDVDLVLYPGEILGLVGDNSAGKSTLMKILTGAYQRDAGEILVAGKPVHFKSPHESRDVGIEMIYQDFALCGNMDVGQNIFLGRWPRRGLFVDRRQDVCARPTSVLKRLKVDVNSVYQRVESLSGGRQQSVAIARAISFEPRVVILDEPTANLSVMATERLLETMLELKKQGVAQIIISHRLRRHLRGRRPGDGAEARRECRRALRQAHRRARGAGDHRLRHAGARSDGRRGEGLTGIDLGVSPPPRSSPTGFQFGHSAQPPEGALRALR